MSEKKDIDSLIIYDRSNVPQDAGETAQSDDEPPMFSESNELLHSRIDQLEKINQALIRRVERSMDQQANSYSLFQSAILLEDQVRARTIELRRALEELETSNAHLSRAKEQAERSNISKTRFLAAASHDLMQPLSAARLSMTALKTEPVSKQTSLLIEQVDRSLITIEDLLRTLFDISKLDAGVSVPEICSYPVDRLMRGLYTDFAPLAVQKQLKLSFFSLPLRVETDPIFLRRILQNLISNALRYTESGGVIVGCRQRGKMIRFEVWDSGAGIPDHEHNRIFDEFHRGKNRVHQEGLGLGLAIVARMADATGHLIDFKSKPDKGSVFRVLVPISEATGDGLEEYRNPAKPLTHHLKLEDAFILLIEDDPNVRIAMQTLLTKWGAQCVSANGLEQMNERLDQVERVPDLIIADYHLGNDNIGPEVVEVVRARFHDEDSAAVPIPSVIVSATPTDEAIKMAQAHDCEFLAKPVEPAELRALINHLLNVESR